MKEFVLCLSDRSASPLCIGASIKICFWVLCLGVSETFV